MESDGKYTDDEGKDKGSTENPSEISDNKYFALVENANDGVVVVQNGQIMFANKKFAELLGYTPKKLFGKNFFDILTYLSARVIRELHEKRMEGEEVINIYHAELLTSKGKILPIEANCTVIEYNGTPAELIYARDLKERRKIKQPLELFLCEDGRLTARQRTIIQTALEEGFYDYPKKINLKELAEEFNVSISTISEIIRRGERNILKHYFGIE
ncbi:MAG: PAS domain S-box protein [Halobacteriota archaeon]|nr:PAS domain S-box protein [Halobacteriota archaeon]